MVRLRDSPFIRSIGRQFDATKGGGIFDEFFAVVDPTRAATRATEFELRTGKVGRDIQLLTSGSDVLDVASDRAPPTFFRDEDRPKNTEGIIPDKPFSTTGRIAFRLGVDPPKKTTGEPRFPNLPKVELPKFKGLFWKVAVFLLALVFVNAFAGELGEGVLDD